MCGRYSVTSPAQLPLRFGVSDDSGLLADPRYNVAPSQNVPVVVATPQGRALQGMRWGFQPAWMKDAPKGPPPINARAETLVERPLFRSSLARHRCLIPADGFFEWQTLPGSRAKQPMYARLKDGGLFAFAGLYAQGRDAAGDPLATCVLITTTPNELMAPVHNRMPAILDPNDEALWLDPTITDAEMVRQFLRPYPAELMQIYPVSSLVSKATNEGPALIEPIPGAQTKPFSFLA